MRAAGPQRGSDRVPGSPCTGHRVDLRTLDNDNIIVFADAHVVVVNDGSKDDTYEVARAAYPNDIASGRLTVETPARP